MSFLGRTASLPTLGIGISTEFGATDSPGALDPLQLRAEYPNLEALTVAIGGESDAAAAIVDGLVRDGLLQESV